MFVSIITRCRLAHDAAPEIEAQPLSAARLLCFLRDTMKWPLEKRLRLLQARSCAAHRAVFDIRLIEARKTRLCSPLNGLVSRGRRRGVRRLNTASFYWRGDKCDEMEEVMRRDDALPKRREAVPISGGWRLKREQGCRLSRRPSGGRVSFDARRFLRRAPPGQFTFMMSMKFTACTLLDFGHARFKLGD